MLAAFLAKIAEFRRDRSAVAATEMAFIAPVIIVLGLAGVDTANYVIATEQVSEVAGTISQMITTTGPASPGSSSGNVSNVDLQFYHDSAAVIFPGVLNDAAAHGISPWYKDIQISTASVQFTPAPSTCTSNCSYKATALWVAGDNPRPCDYSFASVPDSSTPSTTTLPSDLFAPGTIIVVDVVFTYHPTFASFLGAGLTIARSSYVAPRYVSVVNYQASATNPTGGILATTCP